MHTSDPLASGILHGKRLHAIKPQRNPTTNPARRRSSKPQHRLRRGQRSAGDSRHVSSDNIILQPSISTSQSLNINNLAPPSPSAPNPRGFSNPVPRAPTSLTASVVKTSGFSSRTHTLSSMRMPKPRKCSGQRSSSGTYRPLHIAARPSATIHRHAVRREGQERKGQLTAR